MLGMTEVITRDGAWVFDFETVRITPGSGAHPLRQALGDLAVPLAAIETVVFESDRKGGTLRLRPRRGADPLVQATGGALPTAADPYRLAVDAGAVATATSFAAGVRDARMVAGVPVEPAAEYLMPGPDVPLSTTGEDGTVTFDGERVRLEWGWAASTVKKSAGPRELLLSDLVGLEWTTTQLRFRTADSTPAPAAAEDLHCLRLWGFKKDIAHSALVAAAVLARLPHPSVPRPEPETPPAPGESPDTVLRRLRELGDLHRDGVLTDEEFATAKQALLRRL